MRTLIKLFLWLTVVLIIFVIVAFAYLNFVYLPQKVKSEGPAFLEQKSRGQIQAESIQYIPFKGVRLKNIVFLSETKEPILRMEQLYFNVNLWPLIIRKQLDFRLDLYPQGIKKPFVLSGLYRIKQQSLQADFKAKTNLFAREQTVIAKVTASIDEQEKLNVNLNLNSRDANAQGNFYIKDKDLRIEKFSGEIAGCAFNFIGDVQNLSAAELNIYGDLDLNLAGLTKLNPKYSKLPEQFSLDGHCSGKVFIAGEPDNLQLGLKMNAGQIKVENVQIEDLSLVSKMQDNKVSLSKLYAKLCGGELNLEGAVDLNAAGYPANVNLNIFNIDLNKIIEDITGKDSFVHGRFFSLARLNAPLKNPKACEGKLWLSVSGSNILQLPLFKGITEVLRFPELSKTKLKEANGNFIVANQQIRTNDFKISGNNLSITYKGYLDFAGNLAFDVYPSFSQSVLAAPHIGNILGVFFDSAGNFMGEIKLKGTVKKTRHTFKPFSADKILPRLINGGLKELFKLKEKEE